MKSILFQDDLVRAVREGRKTQTRRLMKPQPNLSGRTWFWHGQQMEFWKAPHQPGDVLYVKESVYIDDRYPNIVGEKIPKVRPNWLIDDQIHYRCDGDIEGAKWSNKLFMPAWLARTFIRIESVRVERVQEITPADAIAEGIPAVSMWELDCESESPVRAFAAKWNKINGRGSWEANPFVWVYQFRLTEKTNG